MMPKVVPSAITAVFGVSDSFRSFMDGLRVAQGNCPDSAPRSLCVSYLAARRYILRLQNDGPWADNAARPLPTALRRGLLSGALRALGAARLRLDPLDWE